MSSSYGNSLKITIFGESHGPAIGMVIDGLPSGIDIHKDKIEEALKNRKAEDGLSTSRKEPDQVLFLSGVYQDKTTGTPLAFIIENKDANSTPYEKGVIRPGHADYTNYMKYHGYNDYRGGGFSSGRTAACFLVLGAICEEILLKYSIRIMTHIKSIHGVTDHPFSSFASDWSILVKEPAFPVLNPEAKKAMKEEILKAKENGDSVGGELETVIINAPVGLGEPYFDSLESVISSLAFSIGGVKGIEFGDHDAFISSYGSQCNDAMEIKEGKVTYLSNHNGGINGGIANGEPIYFSTTIKPTSSIFKSQQSINAEKGENISLSLSGRHDPCLVHRIAPLMNAITAYALTDLLLVKQSKTI